MVCQSFRFACIIAGAPMRVPAVTSPLSLTSYDYGDVIAQKAFVSLNVEYRQVSESLKHIFLLLASCRSIFLDGPYSLYPGFLYPLVAAVRRLTSLRRPE